MITTSFTVSPGSPFIEGGTVTSSRSADDVAITSLLATGEYETDQRWSKTEYMEH